ncbi:MAG: hypothetical protein JO306_03165 [Gemmatimonadetes bacterium]|nr:hypothetical protein [Gemmatimonadota bacterium]
MSQVIINQTGPLPITAPVSWPSDRPVLVSVSGSAFTQQPNTTLAVTLQIHSTTIGTLKMFANPAGTHLVLPAGFFDVSGEFGQTNIVLSAANGTTLADKNDLFTVALIY